MQQAFHNNTVLQTHRKGNGQIQVITPRLKICFPGYVSETTAFGFKSNYVFKFLFTEYEKSFTKF